MTALLIPLTFADLQKGSLAGQIPVWDPVSGEWVNGEAPDINGLDEYIESVTEGVVPALALLKANNLSDLTNVATARLHLGLGSAATQSINSFDLAGAAAAVNAALLAHEDDWANPHHVTAAQLGLDRFLLPTPPESGQTIQYSTTLAKFVPVSPTIGDLHQVYDLNPPNTTFRVLHNLGKRPSVRVIDSAGTEIVCAVADELGNENNAVLIYANSEFSGKAILN